MDIIRKKSLGYCPNKTLMKNFTVIFSFLLPLIILYVLFPESFQYTWVGRLQYIIFFWLFLLELALAWRELQPKLGLSYRTRTIAILFVMTIPTAYVVATSFFGLKAAVVELGKFAGVPYKTFGDFLVQYDWPMIVEYIVLAASFTTTIFLAYGKVGLRKILIAPFFLWATAFFFVINTAAPYGIMWELQAFVPFTARSSATVLGWLGYQTLTSETSSVFFGPGMILVTFIEGSVSSFAVTVYWPSAGIQSLFIYTLTILLFIRNVSLSLWRKITYICIGAAGTFAVNVLRIATICVIGLKVSSVAAQHFHDYYGELFFISWMLVYLAMILYGSKIVAKARNSATLIFRMTKRRAPLFI